MSMQNKSLEYNVKQHEFCGFYYGASTPVDKKTVVIVVGGSAGNENIAKNVSKMFAQRGIATMGVCYFNVPQGIIKEVFDGAVLIERDNNVQIVNLDFVTRIQEYPRKKNGKKKAVVW